MSLDKERGLLPLGAATFYILVSLAQGERNGATIAAEVEEMTDGAVTLPPATLYRLVKELLEDGWIAEAGYDPEDQRRRFYRLTPRGRKVATLEAGRLEELVRVSRARRLLAASARV